eukprot:CAMPEP_0179234200 /NCGR_PEP_ID=MMETSP0797-20121207/12767_1 /TAXON_ID=47934 /ORGANISM="Dinophysis acuminata, Strain DAEP01" /LENGTH=435 /DNA_ID=CAMNT_0020941373 /DNA_START=147 /DNA_END=1455 /DNA_ORIENTATION=+
MVAMPARALRCLRLARPQPAWRPRNGALAARKAPGYKRVAGPVEKPRARLAARGVEARPGRGHRVGLPRAQVGRDGAHGVPHAAEPAAAAAAAHGDVREDQRVRLAQALPHRVRDPVGLLQALLDRAQLVVRVGVVLAQAGHPVFGLLELPPLDVQRLLGAAQRLLRVVQVVVGHVHLLLELLHAVLERARGGLGVRGLGLRPLVVLLQLLALDHRVVQVSPHHLDVLRGVVEALLEVLDEDAGPHEVVAELLGQRLQGGLGLTLFVDALRRHLLGAEQLVRDLLELAAVVAVPLEVLLQVALQLLEQAPHACGILLHGVQARLELLLRVVHRLDLGVRLLDGGLGVAHPAVDAPEQVVVRGHPLVRAGEVALQGAQQRRVLPRVGLERRHDVGRVRVLLPEVVEGAAQLAELLLYLPHQVDGLPGRQRGDVLVA